MLHLLVINSPLLARGFSLVHFNYYEGEAKKGRKVGEIMTRKDKVSEKGNERKKEK